MIKLSSFDRILFLVLLWRFYTYSGSVEIERHNMRYTEGKLAYHPDSFKIPSEMCSASNISSYCEAMGGHSVGGCKCECNSAKTTFGYFDKKWSCTANSKVHQHGGCSLVLLKGRTKDSALVTVPLNMNTEIRYEVLTDHRRCYIIPFKSTYLQCNGSWKIIDNIFFIIRRFMMVENDGTQYLKLHNTTWDSEYKKLKGRILRIPIGCYNESNAVIPNCLLMKIQGTMKCSPFSLPPLVIPITSPWMITSTSEHETSISTSEPQMSHPTTLEFPSSVNKGKKSRAEDNDGGNVGLIAGVAVGVFGLTMITVAIVIFATRRRIKRRNKAKDQVRERNAQNGEDKNHEMNTYANAISTENINDEAQSSRDPNTVADYVNQTILIDSELEYEQMVGDTENDDYVNQRNSNLNNSEDHEYEIVPNKDNESKNIKTEEMYSSLVGNVPHVYCSLKGHHETCEDEVDRQVTCTSQNNEDNTYQQLNTFGQQSQDEYQAPNYKSQSGTEKRKMTIAS